MPCFHPLIAFVDLEQSLSNHGVKFRFSGSDKKNADLYQDMLKSGNITRYRDPAGRIYRDSLIPCRQCFGCRMEYSRQWANRMLLELGCHDPDRCYFITLTYSEDLLPRNGLDFLTLRPDHMTDFLKRLRDHQSRLSSAKFRFYYSGEYGDENHHPHFHMIVYDLDLPDLKFLKYTARGDVLFTSNYLDSIWSFGYCFVAKVAWEDCAYTAGYVQKKLKGFAAEKYEKFDIQPEFARMSRRPGIGNQAFSIENFGKGILKYVNGRPITVPDSWKRLMLGLDIDSLAKVKDSRSLLQRLRAVQDSGSDYLPSDRLRIQEEELKKNRKMY